MLQNAYFLAKIGADTAENEQHFAEILPKIGNDRHRHRRRGRALRRRGGQAQGPGAPILSFWRILWLHPLCACSKERIFHHRRMR